MTAPAGPTGPEPVRGEPLALRLTSDGQRGFASVVDRYDPRSRRLVVEWPVEHLRLVRLRPGQRMAIELTRADEGLYRADGLLESASSEEPPQLTLRLDGVERLVDEYGWAAGCQFVESEMAEREQIVAFILAQQRAVARDLSA